MTRKKIIITTLVINLLILLLTEKSTHFLHEGRFGGLESSLLEPVFFLSLSIFISTILLLFFNDKIFGLWLKKFMIWFAPVSVVLIATGSVEVNYGWPTRSSMAINLGVIMFATTLIFALVQHFYYKTK